jgi:hypothetical protein
LSLVWSEHYWRHQSKHPTRLYEIVNINFRRKPLHHLNACFIPLLPLFEAIGLIETTAKCQYNFCQNSFPKRERMWLAVIDHSLYLFLRRIYFWVTIDVIVFLALVEDSYQWPFVRKLLISSYNDCYHERNDSCITSNQGKTLV